MVKVYPRFECADEKVRRYVINLEGRIDFLEKKIEHNRHTIDMLFKMYFSLKDEIENIPTTPSILSDSHSDDLSN